MNRLDRIIMDTMLDKYNDLLSLYQTFQDEEYRRKATSMMTLVRSMFGSPKKVFLKDLV